MTRPFLVRTIFCVVMMAGGSACGISRPAAQADGDRASRARTWVFMCPDESSYVVRATETEAWIFREGSTLRFSAVSGGTRLRFVRDNVELVIEGDNGTLSEPGKEAFTCWNNRRSAVWEHAKLDGVDFRGVGNEPPWVLEMREMSRIVLLTDYGEKRVERPLPDGVTDQGRKMTRWDAGDMQIEITADTCRDTMSGEEFGSRVVIYWQGKVLRGCGRPLH